MACRKRAGCDCRVPCSVCSAVENSEVSPLKFGSPRRPLTFGAPDARTRGICHSRLSWGLQCVVKARRGIGSSCVCRREKPCLDICVNSRITERSVGVRTTTDCLIRPRPILIHLCLPNYPHTAYTCTRTRSTDAWGDGGHGLGSRCLGFDGGQRAR